MEQAVSCRIDPYKCDNDDFGNKPTYSTAEIPFPSQIGPEKPISASPDTLKPTMSNDGLNHLSQPAFAVKISCQDKFGISQQLDTAPDSDLSNDPMMSVGPKIVNASGKDNCD